MQKLKRFAPGWPCSERWMRFWLFEAGAIMSASTAVAWIFYSPYSLIGRLGFALALAVSWSTLCLSFMLAPDSRLIKK